MQSKEDYWQQHDSMISTNADKWQGDVNSVNLYFKPNYTNSEQNYQLNKDSHKFSYGNFASCSICGYKSNKKDLVKHFRKHSGEKPFFCNFCNYRASQSSNLNTHIRKHHPSVYMEPDKNF